MLIAVGPAGQRLVASLAARDAHAQCPDCAVELIVRLPKDRVPHFAHPSGRRCDAAHLRQARAARRREEVAARKAAARLERGQVDGQDVLFAL